MEHAEMVSIYAEDRTQFTHKLCSARDSTVKASSSLL
jgi:hypothetical protein